MAQPHDRPGGYGGSVTKRRYDAETKAAVLAQLLEGQAVSHVAKEYDIPEGTVKSWKRREFGDGVATDATDATQNKKAELGSLLLNYLRESLVTLTAQLEVMRDAKWLKEQSAESLAVLHGVQADKAMRMIQALDRAESSD